MTENKKPRGAKVLSMHEELRFDPESLAGLYRRWSDRKKRDSSLAENQLQSAVTRLREGLSSTDPVLRNVSAPFLVLPPTHKGAQPFRALRAELWRHQTLFNAGVRDVVNYWPRHENSPGALCWLKDDVAPHMGAIPLPGLSHRTAALGLPIRVAKALAVSTLAVRFAGDLRQVAAANALLFRGLTMLVRSEQDDAPERAALVEALKALATGEALPDHEQFGFGEQARFLRKAAVSVAALLWPGESVLDTIYRDWRTQAESKRGVKHSGARSRGLSVIAIGRAAEDLERGLVESLECQPAHWEVFFQAPSRHAAPQLPWRSLPSIREQLLGDWVAIVSEPMTLAPFAVEDLLEAARATNAAVLYTDHDSCVGPGLHTRPYFTPGWSPDLFLEVNYLGGLVCFRRDVFDAWVRAQENLTSQGVAELVLECHRKGEAIVRVPSVLWHQLEAAPSPDEGHEAAVKAYLHGQSPAAQLRTVGGARRVVRSVEGSPKVSVIVPFRDNREHLERFVESFRSHERWASAELILTSNRSSNPATSRYLAGLQDKRIKKLEWNNPYNLHAMNNFSVKMAATGKVLLFASPSLEWTADGTLETMLGHCQRKEVGAVGANLTTPTGELTRGGLVIGLGGFAASPFSGVRQQAAWTAFGLPTWTRNFLAVSADCLMVRRQVFDEIGRFDERFVAAFGDVDLCLRLRKASYSVVCTPVPMTLHQAPPIATRADREADTWYAYHRLSEFITAGDPFYNPNLTLSSADCLPRTDPRSADELARQSLVSWGHP